MNYLNEARQRPMPSRMEEIPGLQHIPNPQIFEMNLRDRVSKSLPAFIIGIALILSGSFLLFWNEGHAVTITRSLDDGYRAVVKVPSSDTIDETNDGKLVHLWGSLSILTPLHDSNYGIRVKAIRLKRRVQMYQWIEEESNLYSEDPAVSRDSSFSYSQMWKDKLVDYSSFYIPWGHENPKSIPVKARVLTAELVNIGAYELSPAIKETFKTFIPFAGDEPTEIDDLKLHNGMYYLTKDIFNPETGDVRIQFYYAGHDGDPMTVIGKQMDRGLHPYVTNSGKELLIVRPGKLSIEEMFSSEHAQNRFLTWFTRLGGWFLIFIGMSSISSIIQYLVLMSPLLRDVMQLGLGSANLTLSMSLSLILIGGAWCFYRPGLALLIFLVATLPMIRAVLIGPSRRSHTRRV